jgi:hypothetical protein
MVVVEHTEQEACLFWDAWIRVTGCAIPGELGIINYWLRNGGFTRQAG